ncbi:MAG: Stp1/IreP family PP2C-type Ser/Thr phosphatase [Firmicutes bacterium]|nr:Stp1/IreP family PP2C-type Ser/Thr phosphatase [Bacillota bacterium]
MFTGWAQTAIGNVRNDNEDSFWLGGKNNWYLALVADGMGGHQGGEVASQQAAEMIRQTIETNITKSGIVVDQMEKLLGDAIQAANKAIYRLGQSCSDLTGMGTTVTVALFIDHTVKIAQVGDSRAYLFRQGKLRQLTNDHSLVQELVSSGSISPIEARFHPQRNLLTRVVGTAPDLEVDYFSLNTEPEDIFLLCTDGLTGELTDDEIKAVLMSSPPDQAVKELVLEAICHGGHDNITVVLIRVGDRL